jgi:Xaa-Pro aminopeptidase
MDTATLQAQRLSKIVSELASKELDVFVATQTSDIRWLTAFSNIFDFEQAHTVVLSQQLEQFGLHTDSRYSLAMRALAANTAAVVDDERIEPSTYVAKQVSTLRDGGQVAGKLRIGIESNLPLNRYHALDKALHEAQIDDFELVEVEALLKNLRAVKDAAEIETLKAAQAITDRAFIHMLEYLRPGLTEMQTAAELEFTMRSLGAGKMAFSSIIASGPNSAVPHSVPGQREFSTGDFVLLDFGACFDDYCSDMTRTVVLGKATAEQRRQYDTVLAAQAAAKELVRVGAEAVAIAKQTDELLCEAGYGALIHGLGHGVGIDIHEDPVLSIKSKWQLAAGHVVTVEPGIYIEGKGGVRIEDYGVVTADGFETFTQSSHELFEL